MKIKLVIHLSKAWRTIVPREQRRSVDELAEHVGEHVMNTMASHSDLYPEPRLMRVEFLKAMYTPMPGAPAWEWWNQVLMEVDLAFHDFQTLRAAVGRLEQFLPPETHVGIGEVEAN